MKENLKILLLEDNPYDAELIQFELRQFLPLFDLRHVSAKKEYIREIENFKPGLILSDYDLPDYDGASALAEAKSKCPDVPFLLVTGAIGEERAIEVFTSGATDYVLKRNLARLGPAVKRALKESMERRDREKAESRFKTLVEQIPAVVFIFSADGPYMTHYVSPQVENLLGISPWSPLGIPGLWASRIHPEDRKRAVSELKESREHFKPYHQEYRMIHASGRVLWVRVDAVPVRDEKGVPLHFQGIVTDITPIKAAQELLRTAHDTLEARVQERTAVLRQSEDQIRRQLAEIQSIYDSAPVGLCVLDRDLRCVRINSKMAEMGGNPASALIGRTVREIVPDMAPLAEEIAARIFRTGEPAQDVELSGNVPSRSGTRLLLLANGYPLKDARGNVVAISVVAQDITKHRNLEFLNRSLNVINEMILSTLDFEGVMENVVSEAARALGCETAAVSLREGNGWVVRDVYGFPKEKVGMRMSDAEVPHAVLAATSKKPLLLNEADRDKRMNREHLRKLGIRSVIAVPLLSEDRSKGVLIFHRHTAAPFDEVHLEFAAKLASTISLALKNTKVFGDTRLELSERTRSEEELKAHARQLEEINNELEAFTYSVSHDLRAPIRAIEGFIKIISREYGASLEPELMRKFNVIRDNTRQMDELIEGLLMLSRSGRQEMSRVELNMEEIFEKVWQEIKILNAGRKLRIKMEGLLPCHGDRSLVRQVIYNLLSNSVKFTGKRRTGVIRVHSFSADGKNVYCVKDNGAGFDMARADRLFAVFQRLHSASEFEGTGVGLAIVQRIVNRHGGSVWAEAKPGKGASFYFSLPN